MSLSHDSIFNMYEMNFILMDEHKYSLLEIEDMMPFEREIYVALLQKKMKRKAAKMANRSR